MDVHLDDRAAQSVVEFQRVLLVRPPLWVAAVGMPEDTEPPCLRHRTSQARSARNGSTPANATSEVAMVAQMTRASPLPGRPRATE